MSLVDTTSGGFERVDIDGVRRKARNWILDSASCEIEELRQEIRKLLKLKASERFKIIPIYDILRASLDEGKSDLSLIRLGLQNVLKYCKNVMKFSDRHEYRSIKTYTGFFKCNVEEYLVKAKDLFVLMGFAYDPDNCTLLLPLNSTQSVEEVAVDLLIAQEETVVIEELKDLVENRKWMCIEDVLTAREQVEDLKDNWAHTLNTVGKIACDRRLKESQPDMGQMQDDSHLVRLPIRSDVDHFESQAVKSPIRSMSEGGTPIVGLSTEDFNDMVINLPPPVQRKVIEMDHHDDSGDQWDQIPNDFKRKHAMREHLATSETDEVEQATEHELNQLEESVDLYQSCNDNDCKDLQSMMVRSQMHESNLSVVDYLNTTDFDVSQSEAAEPYYDSQYPALEGGSGITNSPVVNHKDHFYLRQNTAGCRENEGEPDRKRPIDQRAVLGLNKVTSRTDDDDDGMVTTQPIFQSDPGPQVGSLDHSIDNQPRQRSDLMKHGSDEGPAQRHHLAIRPQRQNSRTTDKPIPAPRQSKQSVNEGLAESKSDQEDIVVLSLDKSSGNVTDRVVSTVNNSDSEGLHSSSQDGEKRKRMEVKGDGSCSYRHDGNEDTQTHDARGIGLSNGDSVSSGFDQDTQVAAMPRDGPDNGRKRPGHVERITSWTCDHCTTINDNMAFTVCITCCKTRGLEDVSSPAIGKECKSCTFQDDLEANICSACHAPFDVTKITQLSKSWEREQERMASLKYSKESAV